MKKVLIVFGTRPEAIKMAPLIKEFRKHPSIIETIVCVTAQHREMLDQVLKLFEIEPNYDLDIMKSGQDLFDVTSKVLLGLRQVLQECRPNIVLVHGDTSTSTAAALAAFYMHIPVGHIEAGLRTNNIYSPWPEELNRQITSRIAKFHFAPTRKSKDNLLNENVLDESIYVTGNTVVDSLFWVVKKMQNTPDLRISVREKLVEFGIPIDKICSWESKELSSSRNESFLFSSSNFHELQNKRKLILITGHRRENFGKGFISICESLKELADTFSDVDFVYPMHLNPNVRNAIAKVFFDQNQSDSKIENKSNTYFIEPLEYLPFVYLMNLSSIILTDSGGIQEEAPSLGKPVLVMRDTTERPEAVAAGTVKLVGTDKLQIVEAVTNLLSNPKEYSSMAKSVNPYGDGLSSSRICEILLKKSL